MRGRSCFRLTESLARRPRTPDRCVVRRLAFYARVRSESETMKRDMELVRLILLGAQERDYGALSSADFQAEGYTEITVAQHFQLMEEGGLLLANLLDLPEQGGVQNGQVLRLTWQGQEFADAIQNSSIWAKSKQKVLSAGGTLTMDALKLAAGQVVRAAIGQ